MKVKLIAVGKLKDRYFIDAAGDYEKRISRFCSYECVELPDLKITDKAAALEKEGREILKKIKGGGIVAALCIEGKPISSEDMARLLKTSAEQGGITFIIGGAFGLSGAVKEKADLRLSMSLMTFPHRLARIILLEQIYRGFKINAGEDYHK